MKREEFERHLQRRAQAAAELLVALAAAAVGVSGLLAVALQ